ncbi:Vacuolar protein sorting-associated protein 4, partial [Nowakowskiella sp. JEL0078]
MIEYLTPCSPGDINAFETTWVDVNSDELKEPPLTVADFVKALENGRKSVNNDEVEKYVQWTNDFGQDASTRDGVRKSVLDDNTDVSIGSTLEGVLDDDDADDDADAVDSDASPVASHLSR